MRGEGRAPWDDRQGRASEVKFPRVLFVCQWYAPEPVSQPGWIVSALRRRGADVAVLTGIPNYPTGKLAPGYSAWRPRAEVLDGVRVWRTPLYASHDANPLRRFLNYASWAISGALFGALRFRSVDVALVYSSPATAAVPAMVARVLFGTPYVLLVQDVWPDSILSSGFLPGRLGRVARRVVSVFAESAYAMASHILVISPGMTDLLESRGVPRHKLSLMFNWVEATRPPDRSGEEAFRSELGLVADDFVVMYAGNHGAAQGLTAIIDAIAQIPPKVRCHLVLVGDGMEKARLREVAARRCPDRVHFVDSQPRDRMVDIMEAADVQLVSLIDSPLFAVTMPSKVQSVMAAAQPVLMVGAGDAARVVEEAEAGFVVQPGDVAGLASAIRRLRALPYAERRAMGERGRDFYETRMSEAVGASHMISVLRSSAEADRRRTRESFSSKDGMQAWH